MWQFLRIIILIHVHCSYGIIRELHLNQCYKLWLSTWGGSPTISRCGSPSLILSSCGGMSVHVSTIWKYTASVSIGNVNPDAVCWVGKQVLKFHHILANGLVLTVGGVKFVVGWFTGGIVQANVSSDEPILRDARNIVRDAEVYCNLISGGSDGIHRLNPIQDRLCIINNSL